MDARRAALALAASRIALGTTMLAAPASVTSLWLGEAQAGRPATRALTRSLGARDVALGIAVLRTLSDPAGGASVQAACAAADCIDALATVLARTHLPRRGAIGTAALAAAAAALGTWTASRQAAA